MKEKPSMNIEEAINFLLEEHTIMTKKDKFDYIITNPQNVSLRVTEKAIIDYAIKLKYPPKIDPYYCY